MRLHSNILSTVGNTPVVRINKLAPAGVNLFAKLEAFNPMGSVKDRLALGVIEAAERDGSLEPGQTVVEATSGNTGIGLAMVCAQKGYPLVIVMSESFSIERRRLMRFLGARVVLTPAAQKGTGMLNKAIELAKRHGWFLARQFTNEANADVHSATTAREILSAFGNVPLDHFVSGYGTGGTLKGVARVLRDKSPRTRIVVAEPDNSALLGSGLFQADDAEGNPLESHPSFRPHLMQGWTPDFVSKLARDAVEMKLVDEVVGVNGAEAMRLARELARQEGIFCGTSGGATMAAALETCRRAQPGQTVLCMLPDTGERYLSTPLFDDIAADMSAEELEISNSTPGFRMGGAPAPAPAPAAVKAPAPAPIAAEAATYVEETIGSPGEPVVLFALEWCEFCWSVRKFFRAIGVPFRSIDLDSVAYQDGDFGGKVRAALGARVKMATIPQVFIGGRHFGGCTDLFEAWREGRVQARLAELGIAVNAEPGFDPRTLLPKWQHPRVA